MAKRRKINQPTPISNKIPKKALQIKEREANASPVFSFIHVCNNHCQLSDWKGNELTELIDTFRKMEQMTWNTIKQHKGLKVEIVRETPTKPLPHNISPDVTLYEVHVDNDKKRVFGYRTENIFRIIWFDREHEVLPYRKVWRG